MGDQPPRDDRPEDEYGGAVPPPPPSGGYAPPPAGTTPAPGAYPPPPPPGYGPQPYPGGAAGWQGPPLAEWPKRAQAALVDWFGPALVASFVQLSISWGLGALLSLVAFGWALYQGYLGGQTGQSLGKQMAGIRLLRERDGQVIGGGMGVVRYIAHIVDAIPCYIGFLFPLWDTKKQTLADKIMGTVVIEA